jgi:hypothetical protein
VLYEAVRDNLAMLLAEASEVGRGLPRYVERDFARYLECGVLAHGFARVRCESCKDELLVAFSCKGRGVCPSCNAKRVHVTAEHLVERVLPHVPYRQWTLSFPHRVRWVLPPGWSWTSFESVHGLPEGSSRPSRGKAFVNVPLRAKRQARCVASQRTHEASPQTARTCWLTRSRTRCNSKSCCVDSSALAAATTRVSEKSMTPETHAWRENSRS